MTPETVKRYWRRSRLRVLDDKGFATDLTLREFIGQELQEPATGAGVYFLLNERGRVVYVGSATNVKRRISAHRRDGKRFTSSLFVAIPAEWERKDIEMRFIVAIQPTLNSAGHFRYVQSSRGSYSNSRDTRCNSVSVNRTR